MDLDTGAHASAPDNRQTILFVCAANVCRSPLMEFLTSERLGEHDIGRSWHFSSAGTMAAEEQPMCPKSAAALTDLPGGAEFAGAHRSRPLNVGLVENAALILVTSRKERSAVARLSASARARTFTMLEAALLVESAVAHGRSPLADPGALTLEGLATVMHRNRGLLAPTKASGSRLPRSRRNRRRRELEIADVHTGAARSHQTVIRDLRWASEHLAEGAAGLVRAPAARSRK